MLCFMDILHAIEVAVVQFAQVKLVVHECGIIHMRLISSQLTYEPIIIIPDPLPCLRLFHEIKKVPVLKFCWLNQQKLPRRPARNATALACNGHMVGTDAWIQTAS